MDSSTQAFLLTIICRLYNKTIYMTNNKYIYNNLDLRHYVVDIMNKKKLINAVGANKKKI